MRARQLVYYPTVTREPFQNRGRVTDLITSGQIFRDIGAARARRRGDRAMLCGSPQMLSDMRPILEGLHFHEGSSSEPGQFVIEKAFVEK